MGRAVAYVFADGRGTDEIARQLAGSPAFCRWTAMPPTRRSLAAMVVRSSSLFVLLTPDANLSRCNKTTRSPFAHKMIERLQAVYAIEAEIRGGSAEQRLAARRARTTPLMEALKARLTETVGQLFSQSKLVEAINYALNHWDGLTLFLSAAPAADSACRTGRLAGDSDRCGQR